MNQIYVRGVGAVSPAGWGVPALCQAVSNQKPLPFQPLDRPNSTHSFPVRRVPPPGLRPVFLSHPRLRRASAISQFATAAALEALGDSSGPVGVVFCTTCGSVNYSRRFYDDVLRDPVTASPILFPETVFNAPASHLASVLGSVSINYTLVGDSGVFLQGLALAARWLEEGQVPACLVVAAEEGDWIIADVLQYFDRSARLAEGAGALLLSCERPADPAMSLTSVTDPDPFSDRRTRDEALLRLSKTLAPLNSNELLFAESGGCWGDWGGTRMALEPTLGQAFAASVAWQCVLASELAHPARHSGAVIGVAGTYQEVIGARFSLNYPTISP